MAHMQIYLTIFLCSLMFYSWNNCLHCDVIREGYLSICEVTMIDGTHPTNYSRCYNKLSTVAATISYLQSTSRHTQSLD